MVYYFKINPIGLLLPDLLQLCQRHHLMDRLSLQMTWVFLFFSLSVFSGKMNSSEPSRYFCLGLWEYEGSWELQELQRQHFLYIVWKLPVSGQEPQRTTQGERKEQPRKSSPGKISIV